MLSHFLKEVLKSLYRSISQGLQAELERENLQQTQWCKSGAFLKGLRHGILSYSDHRQIKIALKLKET